MLRAKPLPCRVVRRCAQRALKHHQSGRFLPSITLQTSSSQNAGWVCHGRSCEPLVAVNLRFFSSVPQPEPHDRTARPGSAADDSPTVLETPDTTPAPTTGGTVNDPKGDAETAEEGERGAIGGFMRGLMGGREVAAEDEFVAEAKKQGIDLPPPPPPPQRSDLVPVKRRRRREEEEEGDDSESIRDRLFSRFAGSAFMRGAFDAKERIAERIDESDNPVINMFRNMYDRFFAENEMAMVVREIREDDASFSVSDFLKHAEEDRIPQILGAYLEGNRDKLSEFCTEDACRMLNASIREREAEGIVMDTNILDIGDVELSAGRLLDEAPVLIVTFSAQQINCLRNRQGDVIEGAIDDIRAVYYVWAFVREFNLEETRPTGGGTGGDSDSARPDVQPNPETSRDGAANMEREEVDKEGEKKESQLPPWKMMEMVIRGTHSTI